MASKLAHRSIGTMAHRPTLAPVVNTVVSKLRVATLDAPDHGRKETAALLRMALKYAEDTEQYVAELEARVQLLESMAITDELTGLINRRGFESTLQRNLSSAARHGETGVLAYLDLDGFKKINDELGHAIGDEVIRAVGRFLNRNTRSTDYAARIGGDEFAVLMVRADHAKARERARELNRKLNMLTVTCKGHKLKVKASLGLASYDEATEASELLERADRAMYNDKKRPAAKDKPQIVKP